MASFPSRIPAYPHIGTGPVFHSMGEAFMEERTLRPLLSGRVALLPSPYAGLAWASLAFFSRERNAVVASRSTAKDCGSSTTPVRPEPLFQLPMVAIYSPCIAAVSLGITCHAMAIFKALAGVKKPAGQQVLLREKSAAQAAVGQAEGLLRAWRVFLMETLRDAWATANAGGTLSWEQRGMLWLASTQAATQAAQAVDLLFAAAGASAVNISTGLGRCLRDVRTAGQHIGVAPTNFEIAGQLALGLDVRQSVWSIDDRGDSSTFGL